jgi:hypothetical protein
VTKIELPAIVDFEQALRNGVILAKLSKVFEPSVVKKIFDENSELKLQYRHSDNINYFFNMMRKVGLPDVSIRFTRCPLGGNVNSYPAIIAGSTSEDDSNPRLLASMLMLILHSQCLALQIFIFETTDLYDKKNIPKVIYCIHALSYYLYKQGRGPRIANLLGKLHFTGKDLFHFISLWYTSFFLFSARRNRQQ